MHTNKKSVAKMTVLIIYKKEFFRVIQKSRRQEIEDPPTKGELIKICLSRQLNKGCKYPITVKKPKWVSAYLNYFFNNYVRHKCCKSPSLVIFEYPSPQT